MLWYFGRALNLLSFFNFAANCPIRKLLKLMRKGSRDHLSKSKLELIVKVATIINPKAGKVSVEAVEAKIRQALFRCDLDFYSQKDPVSLALFLEDQVQMDVDHIVVVGGDGTVNLVANIIMALKDKGLPVPPLCLVSSGTANDLAYELGVDLRIDRAVHAIFSGKTESVDLLKVTADGTHKFMFTNGGIGLTAQTAKAVNDLKEDLRKRRLSNNPISMLRSRLAESVLEHLGPNIYNLMLLKNWISWRSSWEVEIKTDDGFTIQTTSPFILVNNQKTLARRFHTAPATKNNDGKFNLLILNQPKGWNQVKNVLKIGSRRWVNSDDIISKEVVSVSIRSVSPENQMVFIGDGEILHQGVESIDVECIHPGLEMIFDRGKKS